MRRCIFTFVAALMWLLSVSLAHAEDYLQMKSGQVIKCAVLRQDTIAVYTTSWDLRSVAMPPIQVYERSEIESIWFSTPVTGKETRAKPYQRQANTIEGGGGIFAQTFAETYLKRSFVMTASLVGGYTVTRNFGLEAEADFTIPTGKKGSRFRSLKMGSRAMVHGVVHPIDWKGIVPFVLVGGGGMVGTPTGAVQLTSDSDTRACFEVGAGIKWGRGGMGYRLDWRHTIYSWSAEIGQVYYRDGVYTTDIRREYLEGNMSSIRASIFFYR